MTDLHPIDLQEWKVIYGRDKMSELDGPAVSLDEPWLRRRTDEAITEMLEQLRVTLARNGVEGGVLSAVRQLVSQRELTEENERQISGEEPWPTNG